MDTTKLTIEQLGEKVKAKYPQYASIDSKELGMRTLDKYPEYQNRIEPEQSGFFAGVKKDLEERGQNVNEAFNKDQSFVSKTLQLIGQGAGFVGDIVGEGIKSVGRGVSALTPDVIEKPIVDTAKKIGVGILNTELGKAGLRAIEGGVENYNQFKAENPEAAGNLEAVVNIATLFPVGKGAQIAGKGAIRGGEVVGGVVKEGAEKVAGAVSQIPRATQKVMGKIKGAVKPDVTPTEAAGQILQGKTKDVAGGIEALKSVETKGVKTFADLDEKISTKINSLVKQVDDDLGKDTAKLKMGDLATKMSTKSGKSVKINYVDNALKQLDELYSKTGDAVEQANIKELIGIAKKEGLTRQEVNDVARLYGKEFGSKAFSKIGDPLTSVNAQMFENTRKGVKDVARSGITGAEAKKADKLMSRLYNVQTLVQKNVEAVNKLKQKIEKRGLLEKIGHGVSKYADILTGGSIRGLIGGLLPRGAGYKVMNALDLEELLQRNLKTIEKASKTKTVKEFNKVIEELGVGGKKKYSKEP